MHTTPVFSAIERYGKSSKDSRLLTSG